MRVGQRPPIRRLVGWVLVGALCFAALVAIVALLSDSFDETHENLILTSLSFAAYCAIAASGTAARVKEHPAARPLAVVTAGTAAIAFVLLMAELWVELDGSEEAILRAWGVASIVALTCSHAALVFGATRESDTRTISGLVTASLALGAIDGTVGAIAVTGAFEADIDDSATRLIGVTLVLLLLTTGLPPILRRMQQRAPAAPVWPASRNGSLERLAGEVVTTTERIERLDDPAAVRAECRRLRELARTLGG
jgi:hypothetical protein